MFLNIFTIIIAGIITENIVLVQSWGMCPYLGVSKKTNSAVGMGLAVTFVITLSSIICWLLYKFVLIPAHIEYLQTIIFILIIAVLVQIIDIVLKKLSPSLYNSLGVYLALITTNCAVLSTANGTATLEFIPMLFTAISTGLGFLLALILMAGIREKLELSDTPKVFQGFSIALIIAAIMAMAFQGFSGFEISSNVFSITGGGLI